MENYIDLINAYLDQSLSEAEVLAFENRLKNDIEFNAIYNEHLIILGGIERVDLTNEINVAKQNYVRTKSLKYFGIALGVILLSILAFSVITKSQNVENSNTLQNITTEVLSDSISAQKLNDTIKSYVTVKYIKKTIKDEELTKLYGGVEVMRDTIVLKQVGFFTKKDFISKFPEIGDFRIANDTIFVNPKFIETKVIPQKQSKLKSNINKVSKTKVAEVESFFNTVKKNAQTIIVNTEKNEEFTLKEGTVISIPAKAFIDSKTQKEVKGNISLKVTEYYKLSDILLANLTTKSDNKLLETGGMLYINATRNGSKLKLKPEKKMNITFNNSGKPNMQLFKGEKNNDGINWKLNVPEIITSEVVEIAFSTENNDETVLPFESVEIVPVFPGCENGNNTEKKKCMSAAVNKLINRKFDTSIAEDLRLIGKQRIMTSFEIDKEGNVGKIEVRASHKMLAEEAIRVIELLPQLIPGKQKGKPVAVKYIFPIVYTVIEDENNNRAIKEQDSAVFIMKSDKGFIKRIEEKPITLINNSDLERYTLATTNLGWINCDRFVNSRKKKIKYKVKIKDAAGANIKMIFKSISSILPSYENNNLYDFGNVPVNEDIILLAIKKKGDKLYLGIKNIKIKTISELVIEFKEVTIDELKAELKKLNTNF